jgi:hypothetical protein
VLEVVDGGLARDRDADALCPAKPPAPSRMAARRFLRRVGRCDAVVAERPG